MGGVGGRLEPCEGHRWLRCALKRHGQFCCGTRSRSHTRGQRAVHAWWWGGGIDVVHERGSGSIGIFVVLRRHTWSQRHTCGHRAATCGPRGALGAIHVAAHARGGMHETRERSQRAESERCVEKYRCILRICASRRAISRLYMYMRSGGGTRGSGGFAARCEKVTVLVVARRLDFVGRARPTHVLSPRRHSPEAEGSLGGSSMQQQHMQRASSRRWPTAS